MAKMKGLRSLNIKLGRIGQATYDEARRALKRGGQKIENTAYLKMEAEKHGRTYEHNFWTDQNGKLRRGRKRPKPHKASAPGEAPARDSGRLSQSLTTVDASEPGVIRYETGANVSYARLLELGTSKIEPRPFMGPSFDENIEAIKADVRAAVKRGVRRGSR